MKTIDEVIKSNECCDHGEPDSRCEDCPYNGIGACCAERENDALHYLKHLREYYEMSREHHEPNPALAWNELRSMEGKPVWVEEQYAWSGEWHGQWEVIRSIWDSEYDDDPYIEMSDDEYRHRDDMGERWKAYRKEKNEEP